MTRLRRASVIVTLSLLLWAATSSAADQWMLWQEFRSASPSTLMVNWDIVTTTASESVCVAALAAHLRDRERSWQSNGAKDIEMGVDTIRSSWPGAVTTVRYVCLPDTVDPRGPKGK